MRFLHTMIRVGNLQRSIDFYTNVLGMKLLRTMDFPEAKFTLAYLGYESNPAQAELELTYNYGVESYELGKGYGHIALSTNDIYDFCEKIRAKGATITCEPGPMKGSDIVLAFLRDPDGYSIELIAE